MAFISLPYHQPCKESISKYIFFNSNKRKLDKILVCFFFQTFHVVQMSQKEEKNNALPEKDEKCESSGAMFSKLKWNTERYEQVEQIGVGAYGVVFKAKDLQRSKDDTNQEDRYTNLICG